MKQAWILAYKRRVKTREQWSRQSTIEYSQYHPHSFPCLKGPSRRPFLLPLINAEQRILPRLASPNKHECRIWLGQHGWNRHNCRSTIPLTNCNRGRSSQVLIIQMRPCQCFVRSNISNNSADFALSSRNPSNIMLLGLIHTRILFWISWQHKILNSNTHWQLQNSAWTSAILKQASDNITIIWIVKQSIGDANLRTQYWNRQYLFNQCCVHLSTISMQLRFTLNRCMLNQWSLPSQGRNHTSCTTR